MWEFDGEMWPETNDTQLPSYHSMEIHVLVVDHEAENLIHTAKMLEIFHYKVTIVEFASAAIQMLTATGGKMKFDMVMANIHSPDLHGYKLLQQAVNMDLPIILMSTDENTFMAMKALENGAFLYVKKPATPEMIRSLWQHVVREKKRAMREKGLVVAPNYAMRDTNFREPITQNNSMLVMNNKGKSKQKNRLLADMFGNRDEYDHESGLEMVSYTKLKKKACTEWTDELHAKFLDAVHQLGDGKCFPKEILQIMNVPELTRMQVASHLQKCRNENWRSPDERKPVETPHDGISSLDIVGSQSKPRKFGSMPRLGKVTVLQRTDGAEESSQGRSESKSEGHGNMYLPALEFNSDEAITYHNPFDNIQPISRSDEFFSFSNSECLMPNFSGSPQVYGTDIPYQCTEKPHHYSSSYPHQDAVAPAINSAKSQWSSEKSNRESDDSETRGH